MTIKNILDEKVNRDLYMMDKIVMAKMIKKAKINMMNQKDQNRKIRIKIKVDESKPLSMMDKDRMQIFDQVFERLMMPKKNLLCYFTTVIDGNLAFNFLTFFD